MNRHLDFEIARILRLALCFSLLIGTACQRSPRKLEKSNSNRPVTAQNSPIGTGSLGTTGINPGGSSSIGGFNPGYQDPGRTFPGGIGGNSIPSGSASGGSTLNQNSSVGGSSSPSGVGSAGVSGSFTPPPVQPNNAPVAPNEIPIVMYLNDRGDVVAEVKDASAQSALSELVISHRVVVSPFPLQKPVTVDAAATRYLQTIAEVKGTFGDRICTLNAMYVRAEFGQEFRLKCQ